jgi:hypothetical protein
MALVTARIGDGRQTRQSVNGTTPISVRLISQLSYVDSDKSRGYSTG